MNRLTLFLLLVCAPLSAGVWGSRGVSHAFLVRDNLVYDFDGRGVAVYDTTKFQRVNVVESNAETLDGAFVGDDLLVVTRQGIDRYDPNLALREHFPARGFTHLRANDNWIVTAAATSITAWTRDLSEARKVTFMNRVNAIALNGDALYVALDQFGIAVVDLATGAQSVVAETAQDLAVAGDRLYVAGGVNGLVVADISDPLAPRVIRRQGAGETNLARIAVAGTRVAASESTSTIRIFDDSGEVARIDNEPVQTLAASGTRLFVSGTNFDRFGLGTETGVPLRVYDVAGAPRVIGEVHDLAGPVSGAATDGTLAYVVDRPFFRVIDVSNTSAPREIASLSIDNIEDHVKLFGKQVLLYGRGDADLVDVSDPYHPRLVKVFHSFGRPPSNAAFARNTILEGNPWSGFHVVDFIDYPDARQVGGLTGHYYEIVADGGDVAYISGEGVSIAVVDLRDINKPVTVKVIRVGVRQAFIRDNELVVRSADGLHVFSLADPLDPVETSFVPMAEPGVAGPFEGGALVWIDDALVRADFATRAVVPSELDALSPMQIDSAGAKIVIADRYGLRVFGPNTAPPPPPPLVRRRAARP
jgi:hypothetical protein